MSDPAGGMHRARALAFACCLLASCDRTASGAHAAAGARNASSPNATTSRDEHKPPSGSDAIVSPADASSGGTDAALPKNAFTLPGAIDADTGLADLRRIYGAANVREGNLPGGGEETVRGVILFPGDPKRRAYIYFEDAKTMTGLSMVGILDRGSFWRSAQGIRIGMPLSELVSLNGKPFEFFGFEGIYGGWISDWLDGRLASVGDGMSLHVRLSHRVFPKNVPYHDLPYENFRSFRSDQPQLSKMQIAVDEITLNMPGEDDR